MFAAWRLYQALDLYDEQKARVYGYLVSVAMTAGAWPCGPGPPQTGARPPRRRTRRRRTGMA